MNADRLGIEPATCQSQVQRPTASPPRKWKVHWCSVNKFGQVATIVCAPVLIVNFCWHIIKPSEALFVWKMKFNSNMNARSFKNCFKEHGLKLYFYFNPMGFCGIGCLATPLHSHCILPLHREFSRGYCSVGYVEGRRRFERRRWRRRTRTSWSATEMDLHSRGTSCHTPRHRPSTRHWQRTSSPTRPSGWWQSSRPLSTSSSPASVRSVPSTSSSASPWRHLSLGSCSVCLGLQLDVHSSSMFCRSWTWI